MSLVRKTGVQRGSELYFDNLFTSFHLLQKLSSLGIGETVTVRNNKLLRVPLPEAKTVGKMERGISRSVYKSDMVCTVWKYNKALYAASNIHKVIKKDGGDMSSQRPVKSYSKRAGGNVFISRFDMIAKYNERMGGVDLLYWLVALYHCKEEEVVACFCLKVLICGGSECLAAQEHGSQGSWHCFQQA